MKRAIFAGLALALVVPVSHLAGQGYAPVPSAEEYLQFVGGSGVNSWYGVQVGPYTGRFTSRPGTPDFNLYCVDFDHYASSTAVNASAIGGDLSLTRLGATGGNAGAYTQAAYLSSLFDSAPTGAWSALHAAIWTTIRRALPTSDPNYGDPVPYVDSYALRDEYIEQARAAVEAGWTADGWYVLSPDATPTEGWAYRNGQEFLIRTTTAPEPSTYALMATGLLLLFGLGRRRLKEFAAEV